MEYLKEFKTVFPKVPEDIARALLDPKSTWYAFTIDVIGYLEPNPKDKYLKKTATALFKSINKKHLIRTGEPEFISDNFQPTAISLLKNGAQAKDIPFLVINLIQQSIKERDAFSSALRDLFCCVLDFEYGRYDSAVYVAIGSLSITVSCSFEKDSLLHKYAVSTFEDTYAWAREIFLRDSDAGVKAPKKCPYSPKVFLDFENFHDKYGRKLHLASLNEPEDIAFRRWKFAKHRY